MMIDREKYETIKAWYLNSAFRATSRKFRNGTIEKWLEDEDEWGYASYDWETNYDYPIEYLMLHVIEVIVISGRNKVGHEYHLNQIKKILSENDLKVMLSELDDEEKEEFEHDLNLVLDNQRLEE